MLGNYALSNPNPLYFKYSRKLEYSKQTTCYHCYSQFA